MNTLSFQLRYSRRIFSFRAKHMGRTASLETALTPTSFYASKFHWEPKVSATNKHSSGIWRPSELLGFWLSEAFHFQYGSQCHETPSRWRFTLATVSQVAWSLPRVTPNPAPNGIVAEYRCVNSRGNLIDTLLIIFEAARAKATKPNWRTGMRRHIPRLGTDR